MKVRQKKVNIWLENANSRRVNANRWLKKVNVSLKYVKRCNKNAGRSEELVNI